VLGPGAHGDHTWDETFRTTWTNRQKSPTTIQGVSLRERPDDGQGETQDGVGGGVQGEAETFQSEVRDGAEQARDHHEEVFGDD